MARDRQFLITQRQIQNIDRQIADHQQRTNAEIANDQYLVLTGQEECIHPHTCDTEVAPAKGCTVGAPRAMRSSSPTTGTMTLTSIRSGIGRTGEGARFDPVSRMTSCSLKASYPTVTFL